MKLLIVAEDTVCVARLHAYLENEHTLATIVIHTQFCTHTI